MASDEPLHLYPSPALVVRADTPIRRVLEEMQLQRVGSILVVADRGERDLVGIFTERDLLQKIHLLMNGKSWNKPIRTLMQSPVITLGVDEFDEAAPRMLKHGFRHLPVTYSDEDGRVRIAGVLSMRDLFRAYYLAPSARKIKVERAAFQVGLATEDGGLARFLTASLKSVLQADVARISLRQGLPSGDALRALGELKVLVLDLDDWESKQWAEFLRLVLRLSIPQIFLMFDPELRSQKEVEVLGKLEQSSRISVFSKPLNVFAMIDRVKPETKGAHATQS